MLRLPTKAQVAFEFVILVSVAFMVLLVFTTLIRSNFRDAREDSLQYKLKDLALSTQSEITMVVSLQDGYVRSFSLPLNIGGVNYDISQENHTLYFNSSDSEYSVIVPDYQGTIVKGSNTIRKMAGAIEVNVP
jgi:hypothetical protein